MTCIFTHDEIALRSGFGLSAIVWRPLGYPIHADYEEEWLQHTPLSESNTNGELCDLTPPTRTQSSEQEYSDLMTSNKWPSTLYSRNTSQSFSQGTRSYAFSRSTKHQIFDFWANILAPDMLEC